MDLDWTLIEYRPGRYAKVSPDGTFLGTASEAEVRAWFSASAPRSGREAPSHGQDAGQTAAHAPPAPGSAGTRPGSPRGAEPVREPEVPWEKPLIWAPPRPDTSASKPPDRAVNGRQPEAEESWAKPLLWAPQAPTPHEEPAATGTLDRAFRDGQPEPDESWSKPMLWAPPRPDRGGDALSSGRPGRGAQDAQPEGEESWARPMLWGRPPSVPRASERGGETRFSPTGAESPTRDAAAPSTDQPEPATSTVEPSGPVPEGPAHASDVLPLPALDVPEQVAEADEGISEPAAPAVVARDARHEGLEEEPAEASPVLPGLEGLRPQKVSGDMKQVPAIPEPAAEPEPVQVQMAFALTEPAAAGTPEASLEAIQVAMDLAGLEPIAADSIESLAPDAQDTGPEPEAAEEVTAAPGTESPAEESKLQELTPEEMELGAEETAARPEGEKEEPDGPALASELSEPEPEPLPLEEEPDSPALASELPEPEPEPLPAGEEPVVPAPEAAQPDEEEEWLEDEFLKEEMGAHYLEVEDGDYDPDLGAFAPLPASARRPAADDSRRTTDAGDQEPNDLEPDSSGAEDLWLWVDPRYEGGYSPATFDLAAFLQRAIALFQSKAWSGGHPPGRIAVHSDEAGADLESAAERLELRVIEDARVSKGTYWLGLGSDGQPAEPN